MPCLDKTLSKNNYEMEPHEETEHEVHMTIKIAGHLTARVHAAEV